MLLDKQMMVTIDFHNICIILPPSFIISYFVLNSSKKLIKVWKKTHFILSELSIKDF